MYARIKTIALLLLLVGFTSCQEKLMDRFEREAQEFSKKNCPQRYDDGMTILDSVTFCKEAEGTFRLYYTIDVTEEQKQEIISNHLPELREMNLGIIKNSIQYRKMTEAGETFAYEYKDARTGEMVAEFTYKAEDYQ